MAAEQCRADTTRIVLKEFENVTHYPNDPRKSFICHHDLVKILQTENRIQKLLYPDRISQASQRAIENRLIIILSILIKIAADKCLRSFRQRMFRCHSDEPIWSDEDLPLTLDQIMHFLHDDPAQQGLFLNHQYEFIPVVIDLATFREPEVIDSKRRLPFSNIISNLGSGANGEVPWVPMPSTYLGSGVTSEVQRVSIPPTYFRKPDGAIYNDSHVVACKQFRRNEELQNREQNFRDEIGTLQILKESLTTQSHILLHHTTIKHGRDFYILLPYAKYGDLHQFLHCGKAMRGYEGQGYDFERRFPQVTDEPWPLLTQCWAVAGALKWLHDGIAIDSSKSSVVCVHMDLKPDNILIQPGDNPSNSIVGKWMISDFGISVVQERRQEDIPAIVSIQDYYSRLTINAPPRRDAGTYQAPEVKVAESTQNRGPQPSQRGVGRSSDIWSYGCIFSEVLAWAIGRNLEVERFNGLRRWNRGNNYFFDEKSESLVMHPGAGKFEIRRAVVEWLDDQRHSPSNRQWGRCWAETIKEILVVDTRIRPGAERLQTLVHHVQSHRDSSFKCSYLCTRDNDIPPLNVSHDRLSQGGGSVTRSYTPNLRIGESLPFRDAHDERMRSLENIALSDSDLTSGGESISREVVPGGASPDVTPPRDHSQSTTTDIASHRTTAGDRVGSRRSSSTRSSIKPTHRHGIFVDGGYTAYTRTCVLSSGVKGIISVAVSHSNDGTWAAFLTKDAVNVYMVDPRYCLIRKHRTFNINSPVEWTEDCGVGFAGRFLAIWGCRRHMGNRLTILIDNIEIPSTKRVNLDSGMETLKMVAVSQQGYFACVRRNNILVRSASSGDTQILRAWRSQQTFAHAAFNATGDILYAWAYDSEISLYGWKFNDGIPGENPHWVSHYGSVQKDPNLTRIITYNTYEACIVCTSDRRLFPARMQNLSKNDSPSLYRNETQLNCFRHGCVFQDHSLIALKKSDFSFRWYLKEYPIEYGTVHSLQKHRSQKLCDLESKCDLNSRFTVFKFELKVVAIICNLDGSIEIATFSKSPA